MARCLILREPGLDQSRRRPSSAQLPILAAGRVPDIGKLMLRDRSRPLSHGLRLAQPVLPSLPAAECRISMHCLNEPPVEITGLDTRVNACSGSYDAYGQQQTCRPKKGSSHRRNLHYLAALRGRLSPVLGHLDRGQPIARKPVSPLCGSRPTEHDGSLFPVRSEPSCPRVEIARVHPSDHSALTTGGSKEQSPSLRGSFLRKRGQHVSISWPFRSTCASQDDRSSPRQALLGIASDLGPTHASDVSTSWP